MEESTKDYLALGESVGGVLAYNAVLHVPQAYETIYKSPAAPLFFSAVILYLFADGIARIIWPRKGITESILKY